MLPMDIYRPGSRESINQAGYFEKDFLGMEVAVKDSERYEEGWAYLSFRDRSGWPERVRVSVPEGPVLRLPRGACGDGTTCSRSSTRCCSGESRRKPAHPPIRATLARAHTRLIR